MNITLENVWVPNGTTDVTSVSTLAGMWAISPTLTGTPVAVAVTGITFTEVRNGDPIWTGGPTSFYTASAYVPAPFTISLSANTDDTYVHTSLSAYYVSAAGNEAADGNQVGFFTVTLSGFALSGRKADATTARVAVSPTTVVVSITADANKTASGEWLISAPEVRRLVTLGYC